MPTQIRFGTDGWRAVIAEDFTFENVRACAQGVSDYLREQGLAGRGLIVGYDTRFGSERFAAAVAEVSAANGIKTLLCSSAAPTPVVSYNVVARKAGGAVVITASHNPSEWNGFKYKPDYGGSASPEVVAALEQRIERAQRDGTVKRTPLNEAVAAKMVETFDPAPTYLDHISELVDLDAIRQAKLTVVVDSMYGAGAGYLKRLLRGGKLRVVELHGTRNPLFPGMAQPEPIAPNLAALARRVPALKADVGLATDGDADRLGVMDERGVFITQLQTYALLALYLLEARGQRGALVKSITTTSMIWKLGQRFNVPVFETAVGFKYIGPIMMRENALVGGEESGGYGYRGHIPERDGVLSALYILDLMVKKGMRPSQLITYLYDLVGPHHYDRIDARFPQGERQRIIERLKAAEPASFDGLKVERLETTDGFRWLLEGGSWVLVRFSGTEPLLRIYCETDSPARVKRLLQQAREMAGV